MSRFQKLLNVYVLIVGALVIISLLLTLSVELYSQQVEHVYTGAHNAILVVGCIVAMAGMIWVARIMLFNRPKQLFVLAVAVPTYFVGGIAAVGLALQVTPVGLANASIVDLLAVAGLFVLAWADIASAILLLPIKALTRTTRSTMKEA